MAQSNPANHTDTPFNDPKVKKSFIVRWLKFVVWMLTLASPKLAAHFAFTIYATPRRSKKTKDEPILNTAQSVDIPFQKEQLRAYCWGKAKTAILLMHGWESKATTFREFIPKLLNQNTCVIGLDAPAHGGSTGKTTNLIQWGEGIAATISFFKNEGILINTIVSHSMGGSATLYTAAVQKIQLEKFVMISSPVFFTSYFNSFCQLLGLNTKVKKHFEQQLDSILGESFIQFDLSTIASKAVIHRALIIHDHDDHIIPIDHMERMRENLPSADFFTTSGKGHYQIIKDDEVIERIVSFLKA